MGWSNVHSRDEGKQISRRSFFKSAAMSALTLGRIRSFKLLGELGSGTPTQGARVPEIRIDVLSATAGRIGESFCGLSYEKVAVPMFTGENSDLIGLFRRLGFGVLRLGGNSTDQTTWERSGTGRSKGRVAPSDVDGVAAFARATGWKVLYGVNLAQSTPALAADEVAYAARAFGTNLSGIEIGNEPDNYVAFKYFPPSWNYTDYFARWRTFADAILQRTPTSVLTGPATGYRTDWFKAFAADAPKQVRLLTHHYYRANGQLPTSDRQLLISYPDTNLMKQLSDIRDAAAAVRLPFRFDETNSYYNGGTPGVSDSYASALWVIDYLFTLASGGCEGANFHGGGNGMGYTPIADAGGKIVGPRPEYYGIYFCTLAGVGELQACRCDSAGRNITAYAVEPRSGGLNIVVVNKEQQELSVALDLTGVGLSRSLHSASIIMITNPWLSATSGTTIGGSEIGVGGGITPRDTEAQSFVNDHFRCAIPPISAALLKLT